MKTIGKIAIFAAVLLVMAPGRCLALWGIESVSKERAKELGVQVRTTATGPNHVIVKLEFKTEGELKNFSGVDRRIGEGKNAPLQVDRSKPGRVAVSFAVDRAHLARITLEVMVSESEGGTVYQLRVKDFVKAEKGR